MHNMDITTMEAIEKHFDMAAESIRMHATHDVQDRLLKTNEKEREKYLQEFRKVGKIRVRVIGQQWDLILDSDTYRIRKMSGLSRKDFAERYKIPIRTLEKWERQESTPAEYVVLLLERAVKEDCGLT